VTCYQTWISCLFFFNLSTFPTFIFIFSGKNQAIYVYRAIYGRSDLTKCARRQPSWKIKNAKCSSNSSSSSKVAKRCRLTVFLLNISHSSLYIGVSVAQIREWSSITWKVDSFIPCSHFAHCCIREKVLHLHKMCLVFVNKQVQNTFVLKILCRQKMVELRHC